MTEQQNRLYVSGLPWSTTREDLIEAFTPAGEVLDAIIVTDKFSGRSRGFGFVEMATAEAAQDGITMWDGKEFGGRTLQVNVAKPRPPRNDGGGF